ncbi:hypothetical protein HHK36_009520 [Tetracentron sinense]|uniref:ABC transporter domain-containing protein n=1 Tax=Tetracentron sinense TaxID=13715 RepID=A0A834ZLH6_TETSI|nr:hypothetical protein HHK36_009520 [Tetracentron sinense]
MSTIELETVVLSNPEEENVDALDAGESVWQGGGISLTWEDLWVTVSKGKREYRSILQGLTGYAQPGEILAIMGPSGCGKSTLLDALAGRLGSNTRQSGEILINGRKQRLAFGTSAYVTQDDTLMTTLTVKEGSILLSSTQLPESMSRSEKKERGRDDDKGDGFARCDEHKNRRVEHQGLSGGQKRRVTICIEILKRPSFFS